ncbi:MAG: Mu transposase C-terminal domain-containing protein [Planctomycetota bacterium]
MTACPTTLKSSPTAGVDPIDPRAWVSIDEAAERLNKSVGHLSRQCRDVLGKFGQARKAPPPPPETGNPRWYIARTYHLALAEGSLGDDHQPPDLSAYSETQRRSAFARAACVKAYREARSTWRGAEKTWLPLLVKQLAEQHASIKVSVSSLRRWHRDYKRPADLSKLIDRRGRNKGGEEHPRVWEYFQGVFLDGRKISIHTAWIRADEFANAEGLAWCSYDVCRRQLDDRIPPQLQAQFREPERYRFAFRPYLPQDPEAYAAGERWDGDHAVLDLWCVFDGKPIRPWVTVWMDWRSRRIVGCVLSDGPNSSTILAAFRQAMLNRANRGGPDLVWIDNGKDYDSYLFHGMTKAQRQKAKRERMRVRESGRLAKIDGGLRVDEPLAEGVFTVLDIEAHFSIPHNPTGKARVERWFGTLHDRFDKTFKSYCGSTIDKRPEGLAALLKQPHKLPTFEHVRDRLADFVAGYNATVSMNREGAIGLSPDQAMEQSTRPARTFRKGVLEECLQHWHRPVRVGRNGITINPRGKALHYGRFDQRLVTYKRPGRGNKAPRLRVAYDPDDLRAIKVYTDNHRFIGVVAADGFANAQTPVGEKDLAKLIQKQRRAKARRREVAAHGLVEYLSTEEQLADQVRHKEREKRRTEARELKLADAVEVVTPFDATTPAQPPRKTPYPKSLGARPKRGAEGSPSPIKVDLDAITASESEPLPSLTDFMADLAPLSEFADDPTRGEEEPDDNPFDIFRGVLDRDRDDDRDEEVA